MSKKNPLTNQFLNILGTEIKSQSFKGAFMNTIKNKDYLYKLKNHPLSKLKKQKYFIQKISIN